MNRLVWFRNDLRLHDNEMLTAALNEPAAEITFVYVHDSKFDEATPEGALRIGDFRRAFLAEALDDLRERLRALGADLPCYLGDPAQIIIELCRALEITDLYYSRCTAYDERKAEKMIETQVRASAVKCHAYQTQTLLCDEDITNFDLYAPMSFSKRRGFVEKSWPVRPPLPSPHDMKINSAVAPDISFPEWDFKKYLGKARDQRGIPHRGGETVALKRVHDYFWRGDHLGVYWQTRNGLLNLDDSSKFSAALSVGCLSSRFIYQEVRKYEAERQKNKSTLWFLYELLWRDHFHFLALRSEHRLFTDAAVAKGGGHASPRPDRTKPISSYLRKSFEAWRGGRTGHAFIDAAMIELKTTGWLSNRMRQVAASYLCHDLNVDWKMGARWYESCLIDYDPCSNWGNWAYIAGAGSNQPHIFDVDQQARMYDSDGDYRSHWS